MFRLSTLGIFSLALSFVGYGLNTLPATALTTYNFNATYTGLAETIFITSNLTEGETVFDSIDAPFGLTQAQDRRYALFLDSPPGAFIYDSDPTRFGLEDKPNGFLNFFGTGEDKLFGILNGTGQLNFETGVAEFSGPVTIVGGEGRFQGASGTLSLSGSNSAEDVVNPGEVLLSQGGFTINGTFTTPVPEPSSGAALAGLVIFGSSGWLGKRILNSKNLAKIAKRSKKSKQPRTSDVLKV